ncbi:E3 ubiquitin-protein ligase RBBP6-like isoform X2 [Pocillopora damicornis]|uniref:E3 ubiquitin-protein ligase RBBP6-like isoform X2 n=1 Tax=Pocillopora damicornis TaxID=46731 RepID=UPI000F54F548|nr:E3 ubiquitin-protein ligase RBBP6-like isoform X2 [Pocillopora damicornis]
MSCIHYKFRSALEYDTITFDGLSISLADLKQSIITQKKFGKNSDFDLEVTNAQTKEEYKDEMTMIPKNSSVVVRRIPVGTKSKAQLAADRASPFSSGEQKTSGFQDYQVVKSNKLSKVTDLANADASEEDKLKAMMKQSGEDWDPSQYVKGRRPYAPGVPVPQSYVCYRCGKHGHFIRNCPTNGDARFDVPKVKRTTGIPRTFLSTAEGTSSPPTSSLSPSNQEDETKSKGKEKTPQSAGNKKVPAELRCPSCSNLLTDAVLIPCCGTSYCDDCIRNYLLENDQECPSCGTENVSPDSLVINKQLRQAVNTFKNARPASPFVTQLPPKTNEATAPTTTNTDGKQITPATKVEPASSQEKAASDPKPNEPQATKLTSDAENRIKESSPKPVKQVSSQPQQIRIHHRDGPIQQGLGLNQVRLPFDPRRRPGDFPLRGPPRVPEMRHGLSEPIRPHGLPPEHVPRVPAIRPGLSGLRHPGPPPYLPPAIRGMHAAAPALPRMPPVPALVAAPLPRHPAFGPPAMFDPLHPGDRPGSLTPPMSEREFYKMQKKLKTRGKKKREHSSTTRPKKVPRKEGSSFDFDDELLEYRELQKSRQRLRSRSLTPTRSWSRSPSLRSRSRSRSFSRSRSRSRSLSRSSGSPARAPTPEGWDESRSPSPTPSRGQSGGANSAEEQKKRHKKRRKEQKSTGQKKQKTSHKDEKPMEQKAGIGGFKEEEKKKLKKQNVKDDKGEMKDKTTRVEKGKDKPKESKTSKEKEKLKKKDKDKKIVSDREGKGKERDSKKQGEKKLVKKSKEGKEIGKKSKEGKEKRKKKDKDKKEESSGKKRKSKKKHKKHKRHKKGKNRGEKAGSEEEEAGNNFESKENENKDESSEAGNPDGKTTTDEEKDDRGTDGAGHQEESDEEGSDSDEGDQEDMEEDGKDQEGKKVHESDDVWEKSSESDEDMAENGSDLEEQDCRKAKTSMAKVSEVKGKNQREEELLESDQEAEKRVKGNEERLGGKESDTDNDLMEKKLLESDNDSDREAENTKDCKPEGEQNVEKVEEEEMEKHESDRENEVKTGNGQEGFHPELSAERSKEEESRFTAKKRENGNHQVELQEDKNR